MPPLLPSRAAGEPAHVSQWVAILTVATLMAAAVVDWPHAWHTARGLAPGSSERYEWTAAAFDESGFTTAIPGDDLTLALTWHEPMTVTAVRLETYRDAFGTGHRLGIAADTTTAPGTGCLDARLTLDGKTTTADWCTRADQHEPPHSGTGSDWRPDHLYLTQTANLDPPAYADATQVDFYGFGLDTGNAYESGIWGAHLTAPRMGQPQECDDPGLRQRLDDLHLTDRYADPPDHRDLSMPVYTDQHAKPEPGLLLAPACIPIDQQIRINSVGTAPFQQSSPIPLAAVARANASMRELQPLLAAFVIDIRSCDTEPGHCTTDSDIDDYGNYTFNDGVGHDWMVELLGH